MGHRTIALKKKKAIKLHTLVEQEQKEITQLLVDLQKEYVAESKKQEPRVCYWIITLETRTRVPPRIGIE